MHEDYCDKATFYIFYRTPNESAFRATGRTLRCHRDSTAVRAALVADLKSHNLLNAGGYGTYIAQCPVAAYMLSVEPAQPTPPPPTVKVI
jgi:hypothetical protein